MSQLVEHIIYVDASFRKDSASQICWFNETTGKRFLGTTNSKDSYRCEVQAVLQALEDHKNVLETTSIRILLDNEALANQLNSKAGINQDDTRVELMKIWNLAGKKVVFQRVPREQNKAGKMLGS